MPSLTMKLRDHITSVPTNAAIERLSRLIEMNRDRIICRVKRTLFGLWRVHSHDFVIRSCYRDFVIASGAIIKRIFVRNAINLVHETAYAGVEHLGKDLQRLSRN